MTSKYIGEQGFRWFIGTVEDNLDPIRLGRVRVRVLGEHDDSLSVEELPWAQILMDPTSASSRGLGRSPTGLAIGSMVVGFFIDGNEKQLPMVLGSFHTVPTEEESDHGVSSLARGNNIIVKDRVGPEPESSYAAQYPLNDVTMTPSGHVFEVDDTPNNERLHRYHKSGTYEEISSDGKRVTKVVGEDFEIVVKDKTLYVEGNINIIAKNGNISIEAQNDITLKSDSSIKLDSKSVSIESENDVSIKARNASIDSTIANIKSDAINIQAKAARMSADTIINIEAPVVAIKGLVKV